MFTNCPTRSHSFWIFSIVLIVISSTWFCLPLSAGAQTAASKVPLTHETMWMLKRVGAPTPSPDGKWVVFSLVEPAYDEKDQVSDLWIVADGRKRKAATIDLQQERREWRGVES